MNKRKINIFLQSLGASILSLGLSLTPINQVWGEEISDSVLRKYGENANNIALVAKVLNY